MGEGVCSVVVAGTAMREIAALRIVSTSCQTAVSVISVSVWLFPSSDNY